MPYKVRIQNEQGNDIGGIVTLLDGDGDKIGEVIIPRSGAEIDPGAVELTDHYRVTSDGYSWYGGNVLYDENVFTLVKKTNTVLYVALAIMGALAFGKYVKL